MPSEARRGLIRIAANYARLGTTVILGIILVPVLIHGIGRDGYGLYALLGSTLGLGQMFREIMRYSMNRELGHAWHTQGRPEFPATYNAAILISLALAVLAAVVFAVLYLLVPVLQIPDVLHDAARWTIIAGGVNTFFVVLVGPQFNMYMVTERMVSWNLRTALERLGYTSVAIVLFVVMGLDDPARGLTLFSIIGNAVSLVIYAVAVIAIVAAEPMLRPRISLASRNAIRAIIGTSGWNAVTTAAMNLHLRLDQIIVNVFFNVIGNAAFGLGVTLTSYVRMLTVGMTDGLDAAAARLTAGDQKEAVNSLLAHSTRLHALVALPAGLAVLILAEPLLDVWVARRVAAAADLVPLAVPIVQTLIFGLTLRAMADNWTRVLYGAGFVARYAPYFLIGGLLNPVLSIVLIKILPSEHGMIGPALAFSVIILVIHFLLLPAIGARCLGVPLIGMFRPILRPAIVTAMCSPILFVAHHSIERWTLVHLVLVIGTFVAAYAALAWLIVVGRDERKWLRNAAARRVGVRPQRKAPIAQAIEDDDPVSHI